MLRSNNNKGRIMERFDCCRKPRPISAAPRQEAERRALLLYCPKTGWQTGRLFDGKWVDSATLMEELSPTHFLPGLSLTSPAPNRDEVRRAQPFPANYRAYFTRALDRLHRENRYRVFVDIERVAGHFPEAVWHAPDGARAITVWCSNDYLGMGQHPAVLDALISTAHRSGAGAGGTRNISGTSRPVVILEQELADLHGKDAALVFTSGYVSNQAAISTIARLIPDCLIISD